MLHLADCHLILPTLESESVDLIVTDPPYGINFRSNRRTATAKFDHIQDDDNLAWLDNWCRECFRVLKPNTHAYVFTRFDVYPQFLAALQAAGFTMKSLIVWNKGEHGSGDLFGAYAPQHEFIIFLHKGRRCLTGLRMPDVLTCPPVPEDQTFHPTQKPVDLLRLLIEKSSAPGETVLDPFMGSGSTACAAATACNGNNSAPRNFIGVELNPTYYRIAEQRYSAALHQTQLL